MNILRFVGFGLTLGFMGLSSCTPMNDCKNCEVVTYDVSTGAELDRQSSIEYCGPALDDVENTQPTVVGNEKTVWECN